MDATANMHPADINALVKKAGGSLSSLARAHRKHPSSFWHSLRRPIPIANRAIATFLRVKPHELWPEWFDERGHRREPIPKRVNGKSQKSTRDSDRRRAA